MQNQYQDTILFFIIATQPHVCEKNLNQVPLWTIAFMNGFEQCGRWTYIFQPCFHDSKKDSKLLNYPLKILSSRFIHNPFIHQRPFFSTKPYVNGMLIKFDMGWSISYNVGVSWGSTKVVNWMHYNGLLMELNLLVSY